MWRLKDYTADNITVYDSEFGLSVTAFGARGDGRTDDTVAFQRSIDAVYNAGGGLVLAPPPPVHYKISDTLRVNADRRIAIRGAHRSLCLLVATHDGDLFHVENVDGLSAVEEIDVFIEGLHLRLPLTSTGYAILARGNVGTLRDLRFSGGSADSWMIGLDRTNVWNLTNILGYGSGALANTGNGIRYFNSDPLNFPFNFGDSLLEKIDISLNTANTTGIRIEGNTYTSYATSTEYAVGDIAYDDSGETAWQCLVAHTSHESNDFATERTNNPSYWSSIFLSKVNNILMNQIEITGGALVGGEPCTGTIGIHLFNSARITFNHVDLENLEVCVKEDGQINGSISDQNAYLRTFNLLGGGSNTPYEATGTITKRYFLGTDNFPDTSAFAGYSDGDAIFPQGIFLGDANGNPSVRMTNNAANMILASVVSGTVRTGSITFQTSGNSPQMSTSAANLNFFINTSGNGAVWPSALRLTESTTEPAANQDGNIAYDSGADWSGGGEGFVGRIGGSWTSL